MPTEVTKRRVRRDEELELTIDDLAYGGRGVARIDGYVVFVRGGFPGDRVRVRVEKSKRAYAEAYVVELLESSPDRIAPRADHPGALWQVLNYQQQLAVKERQVMDALKRLGGLEDFTAEPIIPAAELWRYRNKLEYSFGSDDAGNLVCGFHAPGRWDQILHVDDCVLASERANAVRLAIWEWCREQGLTAYDRRSHEGFLRNLVIREGRRTKQLQARLVTTKGDFAADELAAKVQCDSLLWTQTDAVSESTATGKTAVVSGTETIIEDLCGLSFEISPFAFFQTNTEMAEQLYGIVSEYANLAGHERVFDLFCGIGTIGLSLAIRAGEVWGLEIVEDAIADAINNSNRNQIDNTNFFAGDVRLGMRELVEKAGRPDVCVIDPPRSGLSKKIIRRVIEASPKRIVYVSCNPTTLAPNAAQLVEAGYKLTRVRPVDMFPQTPHIECVALLERAA